MRALLRIVRIVLYPKTEWELIAAEQPTIDELVRHFILPLCLLAPITTVIGMKYFDASWDPDNGYLVPAHEIFSAGATTLFTSIISVFALAGIFVLIAPLYGSTRHFPTALKVATFGSVPVLLAGATLFVPVMAIVGIFGLGHSLFLYWLGAAKVLHVDRDHREEFVGISIMLLIVVSTLAGASASAIGLF